MIANLNYSQILLVTDCYWLQLYDGLCSCGPYSCMRLQLKLNLVSEKFVEATAWSKYFLPQSYHFVILCAFAGVLCPRNLEAVGERSTFSHQRNDSSILECPLFIRLSEVTTLGKKSAPIKEPRLSKGTAECWIFGLEKELKCMLTS